MIRTTLAEADITGARARRSLGRLASRGQAIWMGIVIGVPLLVISVAYLACASEAAACKGDQRRAPATECNTVCGFVARTQEDPVAFFTMVLCYVVLLQWYWLARQERV